MEEDDVYADADAVGAVPVASADGGGALPRDPCAACQLLTELLAGAGGRSSVGCGGGAPRSVDDITADVFASPHRASSAWSGATAGDESHQLSRLRSMGRVCGWPRR